MMTDPALIEKQDASIPLTVCPQRLDALTDMLRLTHEGAMRACHILVPILLFESLYGGFIPNPGETVVVVLVAQDARASRLSHRLVRPVPRHARVGGLVALREGQLGVVRDRQAGGGPPPLVVPRLGLGVGLELPNFGMRGVGGVPATFTFGVKNLGEKVETVPEANFGQHIRVLRWLPTPFFAHYFFTKVVSGSYNYGTLKTP